MVIGNQKIFTNACKISFKHSRQQSSFLGQWDSTKILETLNNLHRNMFYGSYTWAENLIVQYLLVCFWLKILFRIHVKCCSVSTCKYNKSENISASRNSVHSRKIELVICIILMLQDTAHCVVSQQRRLVKNFFIWKPSNVELTLMWISQLRINTALVVIPVKLMVFHIVNANFVEWWFSVTKWCKVSLLWILLDSVYHTIRILVFTDVLIDLVQH